jgi:hypothetical protein
MNIEDIQKFLEKKTLPGDEFVKIAFKKRDSIRGLFVRDHRDYAELSSKNFWRIVPESRLADYARTRDIQLARIFSGSEFSRLTLTKVESE